MITKRAFRGAAGILVTAVSLTAMAVPAASATGLPVGGGGSGGGGHDGAKETVIELTLTQTGGTGEPADDAPDGTVFTEYGTAALTATGTPFGTWGYEGVVLDNTGGVVHTQSVGTFRTPLGQLTAQGLDPRDDAENAITGGTGVFKRASGYIAIDPTGETIQIHVFLP